MKKNWYYAVKVGRNPGIYQRWEQCWVQIKEYPQAVWTKFGSYTEAENYVYGSNITGKNLEFFNRNSTLRFTPEKNERIVCYGFYK